MALPRFLQKVHAKRSFLAKKKDVTPPRGEPPPEPRGGGRGRGKPFPQGGKRGYEEFKRVKKGRF